MKYKYWFFIFKYHHWAKFKIHIPGNWYGWTEKIMNWKTGLLSLNSTINVISVVLSYPFGMRSSTYQKSTRPGNRDGDIEPLNSLLGASLPHAAM
jgi:hypothetical protein